MVITSNLESQLIGVGDVFIVLDEVVDFADVTYTVRGVITESFEFSPIANNGRIILNLEEITRLVYDNLENYEDPFLYEGDVTYTETDAYHFIKLDISITDNNQDNIQINDVCVINAALQVSECILLTVFDGTELNSQTAKTPSQFYGLNYDLNTDI